MSKSAAVLAMDGVTAGVGRFLTPLGFRAQRRTFNRRTSDGLTHIISLQMGQHDPSGTGEILGFREYLYGTFTVNLGVYIPEFAKARNFVPTGSFIPEGHNPIARRLGAVGPEGRDVWWPVTTDVALPAGLVRRLDRDGLPFLDRFASREAVLEFLAVDRPPDFYVGAPHVIKAAILAELGRTAEAVVELRTALAEETRSSDFVRAAAQRLGLGALDP